MSRDNEYFVPQLHFPFFSYHCHLASLSALYFVICTCNRPTPFLQRHANTANSTKGELSVRISIYIYLELVTEGTRSVPFVVCKYTK